MGCLFFDFAPPLAFDFDQKLSRNVAQIIFTMTGQNDFFLGWIDWSRDFDFRIRFEKTLIAFEFDEKLTESDA